MHRLLTDDASIGDIPWAHISCPNAPNPVLEVDALGNIGLPLSSRDFDALYMSAGEALTCGACRVDHTRLKFLNPAWPAFIQQTTKDVCKALGVVFEDSKPEMQLDGLILYPKNSL